MGAVQPRWSVQLLPQGGAAEGRSVGLTPTPLAEFVPSPLPHCLERACCGLLLGSGALGLVSSGPVAVPGPHVGLTCLVPTALFPEERCCCPPVGPGLPEAGQTGGGGVPGPLRHTRCQRIAGVGAVVQGWSRGGRGQMELVLRAESLELVSDDRALLQNSPPLG